MTGRRMYRTPGGRHMAALGLRFSKQLSLNLEDK